MSRYGFSAATERWIWMLIMPARLLRDCVSGTKEGKPTATRPPAINRCANNNEAGLRVWRKSWIVYFGGPWVTSATGFAYRTLPWSFLAASPWLMAMHDLAFGIFSSAGGAAMSRRAGGGS